MKIRDATAKDATQIAAYWNPQIRDTAITFNMAEKTPAILVEEIENQRAQNRPYLVAEDDDGVMGHATYGQFRRGSGYAWTAENTIILAPCAWGTQAAYHLMAVLEEHARNAGIHSMIAGIGHENTRAIAFHAKLGYEHVATVPQTWFKFGRWMDLVLMQKLL